MSFVKKLILFLGFIFIFILIIAYARGYRLDLKEKKVSSIGILAISSNPKPAKIYINGEFKDVTDANINLPPGKYQIEIKKEGYTSWKKEVVLKGEWVLSLNALLFPQNPSLSPLTNLGIVKAVPLDGTDKTLIFSQKENEETDGIYLFELPKTPINVFPPLKTLVLKKNFPSNIDLKTASVIFSPDYKEAMVSFFSNNKESFYLLALNQENQTPFEITSSKDVLIKSWELEKQERILKVLNTYPKEFVKIASDSFKIISFSPDETKVLYQSKKDLTLPPIITPPLIATNQTLEVRNLTKNQLYVYDWKEDKNYQLSNVEKSLSKKLLEDQELENLVQWHPDSKHLIFLEEKKISVVDYDNLNKQTLYSGPFENSFFSVTSNGNLIILTTFNPETNLLPDLYLLAL